MLRKEFLEVTKQFLYYLLIVTVVPAFLVLVGGKELGTYFEMLFTLVNFSILFFSGWTGINLFLGDKRSGAEDYVLSLPYSRMRLLAVKFIPRFLALAVIYATYVLLYLNGGQKIIVGGTFILFSWFFWMFFFVGVSFSGSFDSYMRIIGGSLAAILLFIGLLYTLANLTVLIKGGDPALFGLESIFMMLGGFRYSLSLMLTVSLILVIPYMISFILAYMKWGLRTKVKYNSRFIKILLPLLVIGVILSAVIVRANFNIQYYSKYLTAGRTIIDSDLFSTRLLDLDGNRVTEFTPGLFNIFYENEPFVYGIARGAKAAQIIRLHTGSGERTVLRTLNFPDLHHGRIMVKVNKHKILLSEKLSRDLQPRFVIIDTRTGETRMVKRGDVLPRLYPRPYVFGAGSGMHNGMEQTFWLFASERYDKYPILKMWENGDAENLGQTTLRPHYFNDRLITGNKTAMLFQRFSGDGLEVVKESPEYKKIHLYIFGRYGGGATPLKEVYGIYWLDNKRTVIRLDLETLEIVPVDSRGDKRMRFFHLAPGQYFYVEYWTQKDENGRTRNISPKNIFRVQNGRFQLIEGLSCKKGEYDVFIPNRNGIILGKKGKLSIYSLPDFKQVK